jgi:HPt (histidine-containing phosphotransfer) domain-containing protein
MPHPLTTPIVDRAIFDAQRAIFGDQRMLHFLALLEDEFQRRQAALDLATGDSTIGTVTDHVHAIASAAGTLGFSALVVLGRRLEAEICEARDERWRGDLVELRHLIDASLDMIAALRRELEGLRVSRATPPETGRNP